MKETFDLRDRSSPSPAPGECFAASWPKRLRSAENELRTDISEEAQERGGRHCGRGGVALPVLCDVLDRSSCEAAVRRTEEELGYIDVLINGAGGNRKEATTSDELAFFDLPAEATRFVLDLNFTGTLLPSQVVGRGMAEREKGVILNISSMNAFRPLTRIPAYSAAKAAVSNFTQWLAVYMCQSCSSEIRVNAIAPGFFMTEQNRFLLTDRDTGELTARGRTIVDHTPDGEVRGTGGSGRRRRLACLR